MALYMIGAIVFGYIIFFILYFVIRQAVEEGTYRALKRYDESQDAPETMMEIGERVQKEREKQQE